MVLIILSNIMTSNIELSDLYFKIFSMLSEDGRISIRQLTKDSGNKSPLTIKNYVEK